jgi:hypothetical protein
MYERVEFHLRVTCSVCDKSVEFWSRVEIEHERPSWDEGEPTFSTTGHTLRIVDPPKGFVFRSMGWGSGKEWVHEDSCREPVAPLQSSVPPSPRVPLGLLPKKKLKSKKRV